MRIYFLFSIILFSLFSSFNASAKMMCAQVIQYAENTTTKECQAFPTPCDVPAGWKAVSSCALPKQEIIVPKFETQNFASCSQMQEKLVNILERYQSRYWYPYPVLYARWWIAVDSMAPVPAMAEKSASLGNWQSPAYSSTNVQVLWVDEADSVKTDGKNLYSYSEESHEVRIVKADDLTLQKSIGLPEVFSSMQMYVTKDKLVLIWHKYVSSGTYWTSRWYAPESKTVVAIYRINDPKNPILERYTQIDGDYRDSRVIDDTLYIVSSNSLRMPPIYMTPYMKEDSGFTKAVSAIEKNFSFKNVAPEIRESTLNQKGKYLQSIRSSVANCNDVTFILPDDTTLKNIDFSPSFISLSSLKISDPTAKMKSQLLFGDVSQIHMSKSALYITSVISQSSSLSYQYRSSTLIHKYALSGGNLTYKYTTTVSGNPMSQYSMDEDANGNFRLVTQKYDWSSVWNTNTTNLFVVSPDGKVIGKLEWIAPGENFQSARFIAKRLYLVTFQQIDPLFVIDVSEPKNPYVLGELKIPGYSTYLHPYDNDRLIGIGYDTKVNQWWGTQNGGLKVDLYNVADVKNPKQETSLILGDAGSSSDVLSNPRAFVYYKEKNLLLLPATLMKSANDKNDLYRSQSAFQWIVGVSILPTSISEKFRVSHIVLTKDTEDAWKKDCAQYGNQTKPTCQRLLDGTEYCPSSNSYVPPYCYAGSTVDTYFAHQMWNYQRDFITRALYVGEKFYSISEGSIRSWNIVTPTTPTANIIFAPKPIKTPLYPVPMMAR